MAVLKSAADTWQFIEEETERRRIRAEEEAAKAVAEKALPKSKRKRVFKPWISLVSSFIRQKKYPGLRENAKHTGRDHMPGWRPAVWQAVLITIVDEHARMQHYVSGQIRF